jgi:hypothetical protein
MMDGLRRHPFAQNLDDPQDVLCAEMMPAPGLTCRRPRSVHRPDLAQVVNGLDAEEARLALWGLVQAGDPARRWALEAIGIALDYQGHPIRAERARLLKGDPLRIEQ